jgi:uncharacterized protein YndB with AHSA1/START domain
MNRNATFELALTRFIRAPREKVFDAFVTEAGMKGWMCPRGMTIPELKLDARVGGGHLEMFPASKAALAGCPKLMHAHAAMKERASWQETQP